MAKKKKAPPRNWQRSKGLVLFASLLAIGAVARALRSSHPTRAATESPFRFRDVTRELGIDYHYRSPKIDPRLRPIEDIIFMGGAVSVADVNGDGWQDVFLASGDQDSDARLYLNRGGRHFEDAARAWGVARRPKGGATLAPVFFDYDNDGRPDLYLAGLGCSALYHNDGSRFVDVSAASKLVDCRNSVGALPYDFDGDGRLDLYVMRYWGPHDFFDVKSPYVFFDNMVDAKNGGQNTLYLNRRDGTFEDATDRLGGGDFHWTYDAAAADFDGDGKPELFVVNDFGPDQIYEIGPGGKLTGANGRLGFPDRRMGMGIALADFDGTGRPRAFISNEYVDTWNQTGNFFWSFAAPGEAGRETATETGVNDCGWAWGAAFGDFDLDGRADLYVANGMLTGTGQGQGEYDFANGTIMGLPGALMSDFRTWAPIKGRSFQGGSKNCLYWNRGDRFENVYAATGLSVPPDGRGVALVDFDNDGALDLLVGTQNGAGEAHLLRNEKPAGTHWVSIEPIGRRSNRDAAGAVVKVTQQARAQYRFAGAKTGWHAISDKRLHFGLPGEGPVDVEIRWPDGRVQVARGLEPGKAHRIEEDASR